VDATPDAIALYFEGAELTYAELDRRSNRLARHLIALGAGPDRAVAIGMERSVEAMVAFYAVLKSGGTYVPLDPEHPSERTAYVLESAAPIAVLTRRDDGVEPGERDNVLFVEEL